MSDQSVEMKRKKNVFERVVLNYCVCSALFRVTCTRACELVAPAGRVASF